MRLHIDHAGPLCNKMILVIMDAHSKWIEALPVPSAMSSATIGMLYTYTFVQFGIPKTVASDNATFLEVKGLKPS